MAAIKLKITVSELENVLTLFNRIKVYRCDEGIGGTYVELTDEDSRIRLTQGVTLYIYDDPAGSATSWYKTSYYHTETGLESGLSDPRMGEDLDTSALIMSVQDLKDLYLFGLDLTNDQGEPFPEIMFEWGIRQGLAWLERNLDLKIQPTRIVERYDYYRQDYQCWCFIRLRQAPITAVHSVTLKWPGNVEVLKFPDEWIQLRKEEGQVNIVPAGSMAQVLLTGGGSFLPILYGGVDFIPNAIEIDYTAGFETGMIPIELRDLIGKAAALGALHIAGDLIGGAGIASKSVSIDGLSQSVSTTSSPSFAGYGARVRNYLQEIKTQIPLLRRYYKGVKMVAV